MNLIELDKKATLAIQKRYGLSNYQMLCLSWAIGVAMGFSLALILHWLFLSH